MFGERKGISGGIRLVKYGQLTWARCWSLLLYRRTLSVSLEALRPPNLLFVLANLLWMPPKGPGFVPVPSKAGLSLAGPRMLDCQSLLTQRGVSDTKSKVRNAFLKQ